jgi:hypothetical protein
LDRYYPFDHAFLGRVANRIINEVRGINRVTYDITSKPPGKIEWASSRLRERCFELMENIGDARPTVTHIGVLKG